jgi:hypothetical protein
VIVFDTETTVDRAQRLLFGSDRFYGARPIAAGGMELVCVDEGILPRRRAAPARPGGLQDVG